MADGYPVHGLHQAYTVKAESCWKIRDYSDPNDPYGCGGQGTRTCAMVDQYDPSQGTTKLPSDQHGPAVTDPLYSSSNNPFVVESGFFFEDYYYDAGCTSNTSHNAGLDEHNGHSHGSYGYHYHMTESFPYTPGPTYYGEVPENSFANSN